METTSPVTALEEDSSRVWGSGSRFQGSGFGENPG